MKTDKTAKQIVDEFIKTFDSETKPLTGMVYNEDKTAGMNVTSYFELLAQHVIDEMENK